MCTIITFNCNGEEPLDVEVSDEMIKTMERHQANGGFDTLEDAIIDIMTIALEGWKTDYVNKT